MEETKDQQENRFVNIWVSNRLDEDPDSEVIKVIESALNGESLDEPKLLKALEELVKCSEKGGLD